MDSIADIFARRDAEQKAKKRRRNHVAVWDAWGAGNDADLGNDPLTQAPVLTWVSDETDNLPNFSIDWPDGFVVGTAYELEISDDINFGGTPDEEILGDGDSDPTEVEATTPLADGTWYARVRYTGSEWSNVESKTIATLAAPGNTVAPAISGNTQVGQLLTTTNGTWDVSVDSYTYQWKRDGSSIGSATASTYTLVAADAGADITCEVTATNGAGSSTPAASNALGIDVYLVYLGHDENASDLSSYTFSSKSLGDVAANRKVVVCVGHRDGSGGVAPSSVTVAGNAMSLVPGLSQVSGGNNRTLMYIIDETVNATANIVVTVSSLRCGIGWWAIYGAGSSAPSDSGPDFDTSGTTLNDTLTVPAKGVGIGYIFGNGTAGYTFTWTAPLVENFDAAVEGGQLHSGASFNSNAGGSIAFQVAWSAAPVGSGAVFAAWGP